MSGVCRYPPREAIVGIDTPTGDRNHPVEGDSVLLTPK